MVFSGWISTILLKNLKTYMFVNLTPKSKDGTIKLFTELGKVNMLRVFPTRKTKRAKKHSLERIHNTASLLISHVKVSLCSDSRKRSMLLRLCKKDIFLSRKMTARLFKVSARKKLLGLLVQLNTTPKRLR
jgi:hypothetical protein